MTPSAAPTLPGHYQLRTRLGEGGFGEVFEAWDDKLCRSVAIKRLKPGLAPAAGATLLHEARLAASLRHAAFVKVHAIEDDALTQFIVMELVSGKTLKEVLAGGAVNAPTALGWIAQVAEAMRDAHASTLVHGDLKPSNLMLEPDGKVRILDFGLAMRHDALATSSLGGAEPQGTIAYMAPERLLGARPSPQADVYALGVLLYELLCGTRPFADLQGLALAAAHMQSSSDAWTYPDSLDAHVVSLVRAMTARMPALRLRSMDEVLERVAALAGAGTASLPRWPDQQPGAQSGPLPHLQPDLQPDPQLPGTPRPRVVLAAAGACAVLLLAVLAWRTAPALSDAWTALAPLSESAEMNSGLAALSLFDRPGSLEAAGGHFQRILARYPDNAAAVAGMSLAYSLRYVGDRQDEVWLHKADASAQQALRLDAQLALSHVARGWVLNNQGQRDAALAAYARALALDPGSFLAWYGQVQSLRQARRYPAALARVRAALQRFPRERVFTDELGSIHYEQGDLAAAEQMFRRSIALQPDAVAAYANLNAALLRQNRGDEALQVLQQGLQVRPNAKLYGNLGNALFLRGDYVGAADAFTHAVSPTHGAPGEYLNWANLADTLLWIPGREQQARAAYDKARRLLAPRLARSPGDVLLVSRMGLYCARAGDGPQALALLGQSLAMAPASADVQFRAALAYELLGHREQALRAISAARRLGYPVKFIDAEPDLVALRRDPAYPAD